VVVNGRLLDRKALDQLLAEVDVAASLANAIFDATGVRLRSLPFTAVRVRGALKS